MGILDSAVLLLQAKNYSGSGEWLDESGNGHHAQFGSTAGSDTNDPQSLPWDGQNYLRLPGAISNFASSPDAAVLDLGGDFIEIEVRAALDDWSPGTNQQLVTKTSTAVGWDFYVNTGNGRLRLLVELSGGTEYPIATVVPGFSDGTTQWVKVTRNATSGDVIFYTGGTGTSPTWVKLGNTVSTTSGAIQTSNFDLGIGARGNGAGTPLAGAIYRVLVYNDSTLVFDVDFNDATEPFSTFTERSSNAATVTIARTGPGLYVVDQPSFGLYDDDYFEIADHPDLDFAANEAFTAMALIRSSTIAAGNAVLVGKKDDLTTSVGWSLYRATAAGTILIGDGSADDTDAASSLVARTAATVAGVRNIGDDDIEAFLDGTGSGSPTADSTTATLANALPLRIGATSGTAASFFDGEIMAVVLWRSALTDADIVIAKGELTLDKSGAGSITETHTVVGEGRKNASDTGAIFHGHTVVGQGDKAVSATAAIFHSHTTVGEGAKAGLGTSDISHGHTVVAAGGKQVSDTAAISHGHTIVAAGFSSEANLWTADPVAYTPAPVAHTRLVPGGSPWSE